MALSSFAALSLDSREQEVRVLVELVRLSRVTLLIAEHGSDKSAVLRSMVMPLIQDHSGEATTEVAVLFDWWQKAPLAVLNARIDEALARVVGDAVYAMEDRSSADHLAARLAARQEAFDCKFVIILDRFEQYLAAPAESDEIREFAAQFVEAVNNPAISANFVLSIDERAAPQLARFRAAIPGFGNAQVRLTKPQPARAASPAPQRQTSPDRLVGSRAPEPVEAPATAPEVRTPMPPRDAPRKSSWTRGAIALVIVLAIVSSIALLGIRGAGEPDGGPIAAAVPPPNTGAAEIVADSPSATASPATPSAEPAGEKPASQPEVPIDQPSSAASSVTAAEATPAGAAGVTERAKVLLYITVGSEAQRDYAESIVAPLARRGVRVGGIRVARDGPPISDLRYFHSADRAEAATINRALDAVGRPAQRLRYVPGAEDRQPRRHFELWLPAS